MAVGAHAHPGRNRCHGWVPERVKFGCETRGAYRVIYVAKFADAVYVLHAFQKKTQRTAPADLELAKQRYREALAMVKTE